MLGGNPRVEIVNQDVPPHISDRLDAAAQHAEKSPDVVTLSETVVEVPEISLDKPAVAGGQAVPPTTVKIAEKEIVAANSSGMKPATPSREDPSTSGTASLRIDATPVTLGFGSLHGSVYTPDQGSCVLPWHVIRGICGWDIRVKRSIYWYFGVLWFGAQLLLSIAMQVVASKYNNIWAEILSIGILLLTSLARGSGLSGSEEWMIPSWKRGAGRGQDAQLLRKFNSR
jgi:hypothetical protein